MSIESYLFVQNRFYYLSYIFLYNKNGVPLNKRSTKLRYCYVLPLSSFRDQNFSRAWIRLGMLHVPLISRAVSKSMLWKDSHCISVWCGRRFSWCCNVGRMGRPCRTFSSSYVYTCPRNNDCQLPQLEHRAYRTKARSCSNACKRRQFSTDCN